MQIQNKQLSLQNSNEAISTEQRNLLHNSLIINIGIKSKTFLHTTQENAHFINIWSQGEDKKSISVITLLINKLVRLLHFLAKIIWLLFVCSIKSRTFAPVKHRGVEQLVARWAHNPKVIRSSRISATK